MSWQEEIDHAVVPPQWQNEAARTRRVPVSLCVLYYCRAEAE